MGRKRHTAEQIIRKLRAAEVELAKGQMTVEVARTLGITEQTCYRWRKEYGVSVLRIGSPGPA
jgi:transposase-like protein